MFKFFPARLRIVQRTAHHVECCIARNYSQFKAGDIVTITRVITESDIQKFSELSGDTNPIHSDPEYVKQTHSNFEGCVVHGAFLNSLVSSVIGTRLPGPGTVVVKQELNFPAPCYVGEEVEVAVKLTSVRKILTVDFVCRNNKSGLVVMNGNAKLVKS